MLELERVSAAKPQWHGEAPGVGVDTRCKFMYHLVALAPMLINLQGAFVSGSARSFDGPAFVASSKEPLIVVNFNYRVCHSC